MNKGKGKGGKSKGKGKGYKGGYKGKGYKGGFKGGYQGSKGHGGYHGGSRNQTRPEEHHISTPRQDDLLQINRPEHPGQAAALPGLQALQD